MTNKNKSRTKNLSGIELVLGLLMVFVGSWPVGPIFNNFMYDPNNLDLSYTADFIASVTGLFTGYYSASLALTKKPLLYNGLVFFSGISIPILYSLAFQFLHYLSISITYIAVFCIVHALANIPIYKEKKSREKVNVVQMSSLLIFHNIGGVTKSLW